MTIGLLSASYSLVAQDTKEVMLVNETDLRDRLTLGFKLGGNYSNVYDAQGELFTAKAKVGFAAGAMLAIPLGKLLGLQPEIIYSEKGFKGSGSILTERYDLTRTSYFIDVPLLFAVKPTEFVTILAGPQFSYLFKQKDVFSDSSNSLAQEQAFSNENLRKNILCFTGGIDLTMKHLVLSGRVGWDIQKNTGDGSVVTPRYKNVWYQATIGYRLY